MTTYVGAWPRIYKSLAAFLELIIYTKIILVMFTVIPIEF